MQNVQYDQETQLITITTSYHDLDNLDIEEIKKIVEKEKKDKPFFIEYLVGMEQHTSYWGKFYVKGLEDFVSREDSEHEQHDGHYSFSYYCKGVKAEDNLIFTVFVQEGNKYGTDRLEFMICQLDHLSNNCIEGEVQNKGFINGSFRILASAKGKTKGKRLLDWWEKRPKEITQEALLAYIARCANSILIRGRKMP